MPGEATMQTAMPSKTPAGALRYNGMLSIAQLSVPTTRPTPAPTHIGFCMTRGSKGGAFLGFERSMLRFERLSFSVAIMVLI